MKIHHHHHKSLRMKFMRFHNIKTVRDLGLEKGDNSGLDDADDIDNDKKYPTHWQQMVVDKIFLCFTQAICLFLWHIFICLWWLHSAVSLSQGGSGQSSRSGRPSNARRVCNFLTLVPHLRATYSLLLLICRTPNLHWKIQCDDRTHKYILNNQFKKKTPIL